jgi:hypothetical protein
MTKLSCPIQPMFIIVCYVVVGFGNQTETKAAMKMQRWNKTPAAALAVFGLSVVIAGYARRARATDTAPTQIIAPAQISLPDVPAAVLQMSESSVSDPLIISYIQKSANSYSLSAQQIIYLHDLGVSSAALNVLVQDGAMGGQAVETASGTANPENVSPASTPPVSGTAADFYDSLAPYGTWVNVPNYGWCWKPTVEVINPVWQPYCNNGTWLWTDQGWYWNSYYSWGWAPFHYGRWCQYPGCGWLWCPDNGWGPAWVCWRNYPGYCGWAPLPPGACFTAGVGWTFNGLAVGINYGFGLGPRCFTFCGYDDFCRRFAFHHFLHGPDADRCFDHSRVDNDFALDARHHFINRGIDLSRIEAATHARIQPVAVHELPHRGERSGGLVRPDRLMRGGNAPVIYRPGRNLSVGENHFQPEHGVQPAYHWGGETTARGFTAERTFGNTPRFQTARPNLPNDWRHSAPDVSRNQPALNAFDHNQRWGGVENPRVNHFPPTQDYHRDYSDSRHFTPTYHSAPAWRSTPVFHPAPTWHSAPVQHSAPSHSWGGETHFGGGMAQSGGFHR